jgi:hypothetical protein
MGAVGPMFFASRYLIVCVFLGGHRLAGCVRQTVSSMASGEIGLSCRLKRRSGGRVGGLNRMIRERWMRVARL